MNSLRNLIAVLLLGSVLAIASPARADDAPDPFLGLASESFDEVASAIAGLAVSGNPQAAATIQALQDETLFVGPAGDDAPPILIKTDAGFIDARTNKPVADVNEDDLVPVKVNNAVRRAIEAAKGGLDLFAADPALPSACPPRPM